MILKLILICFTLYFVVDAAAPSKCTAYFSPEKLRFLLSEQLVGQHIAATYITSAISSRLHSSPKHALSVVLAGSTGTGKNLMSSLVAESVFGPKAMKSDFVHLFSGRLHFPLATKIADYQRDLYSWVKGNVTICPSSIFIFDEIDKMPPSVLDILKSFLDYHHSVEGIDYRSVIFLFLTNWGGLQINSQYRKLLASGKNRDEMKITDFERILKNVLFESGMLKGAESISNHLINAFIPFLPLERKHVEQCIRFELSKIVEKPPMQELVIEILDHLDFHDRYSVAGCKSISHIVNIYVYQQNERYEDEL